MRTRSLNQHPENKTSNEIQPIDKYKVSVVIVDDMLGARKSSQRVVFIARGRLENLDVHYCSQGFFGLLRQSMRNNSDRLTLFTQNLKDVESMYRDKRAYDMN